jgi:hypothetical protein
MQRVKLFKSIETDVAGLEKEINDWIESSGARIVHSFGNIAAQTMAAGKTGSSTRTFESSDLFVGFVYEQGMQP